MIGKRVIKILQEALLILIHTYQHTLSLTFGPCCRFYPSCSSYAIESIERFGITKGVWLSMRRIIKCHPFNPGGYDPVIEINKNL
ncbi:MAG: membrane protein insertion efficiency factor YidD [Deltaproteobacteria bacterium]|nr:membrane protein insertion efficiency factor YidD [Deltaproteobacteria bacterium]MBM4322607.1 membrane protein insertion efficiency factor YidD [Deltaproteobacteria bacterium]MBM4347787.1 membrane protein insertion efficiency factor YidD [Deltaproteobacteria bacterium]